MFTFSYRGFWIHGGFSGPCHVQRPDHSMVPGKGYTTVEGARAAIRRMIRKAK